MAGKAFNTRMRRRQRGAALLKRYEAESVLTIDKALEFVQTRAPAEQREAAQLLKDVAGRTRADTVKALQQLSVRGPLPPPQLRIMGGPTVANLPQRLRRPVSASPKSMAADLDETLAGLVKRRPATFGPLLKRLGSPSATELAALLQRPVMWGAVQGAGRRGQIRVLVGLLFQEMRKSAPEFAAAMVDADRTRHAFNKALRSRRVAGLPPREAEAAAQRFAAREEFGPPTYYDNVVDGNGKQLSDGMRVSWNADGRVLVTSVDEAKYGVGGPERAPAQQDDVLRRIKKHGVILGRDVVSPDRIDLPVRSGVPGVAAPELTAYYSDWPGGVQTTPGGYSMQTVVVPASGLPDLAAELLAAWDKQIKSQR
jgi:hypothetical protein